MQKKVIILTVAVMMHCFAPAAMAKLFSADKKLEVDGTFSHQSMWRLKDKEGNSDFNYIMGRHQFDVETLYHLAEGSGGVDKIDLFAILRGYYDSLYNWSDEWGAGGGYFSKQVEDNIKEDFDVREIYADIEIGKLALRLGKQQIVWGKTDLFRLLDIINPMDYSWHFFFEGFDDIRIPLTMGKATYAIGNVGPFKGVSLEVVVNPDDFKPTDLGRFGMPWALAPQGFELYPVDKPSAVECGGRIQARIGGFSFTLNDYYTFLDDPIFDLEKGMLVYPRVYVLGGAVDYYDNFTKSVFRLELAYTPDKEMGIYDYGSSEGLRRLAESPDGIVKRDELKYCIGIDRPTFIRFLNPTSTWFLSGQLFVTHILDYDDGLTNDGAATKQTEAIFTFVASSTYMNGRLLPNMGYAYDFEGEAHAALFGLKYLFSNYWSAKIGANLIWGKETPYANFGAFRNYDEVYAKFEFSF